MDTKTAASNTKRFLIEAILRWRNFHGSTVVCQACGEYFDFTHEMGPRPRTCSECSKPKNQKSGLEPENEERTDRYCEICASAISDDKFNKEVAQVCSICLSAIEVGGYRELPDLLHLLRARRFLESLPIPELRALAGELNRTHLQTQWELDQSEPSELPVPFDYNSVEILYPRDLVLKALAFPLSQEEQDESRDRPLLDSWPRSGVGVNAAPVALLLDSKQPTHTAEGASADTSPREVRAKRKGPKSEEVARRRKIVWEMHQEHNGSKGPLHKAICMRLHEEKDIPVIKSWVTDYDITTWEEAWNREELRRERLHKTLSDDYKTTAKHDH